jgi:phosphatidylglycerophosphate synthase
MSNNDVLLLSMIPIPFILINSSNKIHLKQLLIDPIWYIQLILAILLTVITIWFYKVYDTNGEDANATYIKIRKSLFAAWLAFMIALCSEFHLLLAPFWIVFVSTLLYQE